MKYLLAALLLSPGATWAHDAPSGWQYPWECCHDQDCRQVAATAVKQTPSGYVIVKTGEVIPWNDPRIHFSPDGLYHWCARDWPPPTPTLCLFVPMQGS